MTRFLTKSSKHSYNYILYIMDEQGIVYYYCYTQIEGNLEVFFTSRLTNKHIALRDVTVSLAIDHVNLFHNALVLLLCMAIK